MGQFETDEQILKLRPCAKTPPEALEVIARMKQEALARRDLRKIEMENLGVEVEFMQAEIQKKVAQYVHDVAHNRKRPKLLNGMDDARDGEQYILENSANIKNSVAVTQMLKSGVDPTANNVQIAILERTKSAPVSASDLDLTVERTIE
jgi:hypothetical protein